MACLKSVPRSRGWLELRKMQILTSSTASMRVKFRVERKLTFWWNWRIKWKMSSSRRVSWSRELTMNYANLCVVVFSVRKLAVRPRKIPTTDEVPSSIYRSPSPTFDCLFASPWFMLQATFRGNTNIVVRQQAAVMAKCGGVCAILKTLLVVRARARGSFNCNRRTVVSKVTWNLVQTSCFRHRRTTRSVHVLALWMKFCLPHNLRGNVLICSLCLV